MSSQIESIESRFIAPTAGDLFARAVDRTVGAPRVTGNAVSLLRDGNDNYPAWLAAIRAAQRYIYFESYIIYDDDIGRVFCDALCERARDNVRVRLIYDWLGAFGKTPRSLWRRLAEAGVEVRCYNPPRITSPLGWVHRDHRKLLSVDGDIAFISGLCVGKAWAGDPARGVDAWRDTGVQIKGPAVADVERAFTALWSAIGEPIPGDETRAQQQIRIEGDVTLRVVVTTPGIAGLLRLDQLIAASAQQRLWLADAYFAGIPTYVQALAGAARDGVDVRLLVPGSSDLPMLRNVSRAGYRPLLQAGVRVFEWKGAMMHAKTAVADGRWARVGSSNLNIASWLGNHELDAVIEDERFAGEMETMYLQDLENSTEIVLYAKKQRRRPRVIPVSDPERPRPRIHAARSSGSRATAGALRLSNAVAAAITDQQVLVTTEGRLVAVGGIVLIVMGILSLLWPRIVTIPLALLLLWSGFVLLAKAFALRQRSARGVQSKQNE